MLTSKIVNNLTKNKLIFKLLNFIHIDSLKTPNPNFLKFVPSGKEILGDKGTLDISGPQFAQISPLAQQLFGVEGVTRVFLASDYLSISKRQDLQWSSLKPQIFSILNDFLENQKPIISAHALIQQQNQDDPNDSQTVQFIKQIIASRIRPTVQQDGGDVKFVSFDEQSGTLTLKMMGACSGCPSSAVTLKQGIQKIQNKSSPKINEHTKSKIEKQSQYKKPQYSIDFDICL